MPIRTRTLTATGDTSVERPWVGPVSHTMAINVPIGALTTAEVDSRGFLKAGLPLSSAGALVGAGVAVHGCVVENTRVANSNSSADLTAAGTVQVTVGLIGTINRAILEDNLGRVLTANEIAGFALAGSLVKLLS